MWKLFNRTGSQPKSIVPPLESVGMDEDSRHRRYDIAEVEVVNQMTIVTFTIDELTQDEGADRLASLLDDLVARGHTYLILDIQNVTYMDSACVGCMVEALNRLAGSGGRIALANPASSVAHLFRLTRLDRVFPICNDVLAAMNIVERSMYPE